MQKDKRFIWVDFYQKFADKLLEYRKDRTTLLAKLQKIYDEINEVKFPKLEKDGSIKDIDPFTVFALFNKGIRDKNRNAIISAISKEFVVQGVELPSTFYGIPVLNNMKANFFGFDRGENDIDNLWDLFECAISYTTESDSKFRDQFIKAYDTVIAQPISKWMTTIGLFWIRPNKYIGLDECNRNFLIKSIPQIIENHIDWLKKVPSAEQYLVICECVNKGIKSGKYKFTTIPEMSYCAWTSSHEASQANVNEYKAKGEKENQSTGSKQLLNFGRIQAKNIILYGPPGTGKTYNTVRKAVEIIEPDKGWGDKDYKAVKEEYNKLLNEGRINFVTFHQSYGYEEFIEGIKPSTDGGNVTYKVEQGVFLQFCESAKKAENKDKNFVFIIDEINRGNISKIFGELITLIEDNKRDGAIEAMSVKLPYSHKSFSVPDNIYIIGTMNTADRSIAAIDTALRRRFTFIEMMPDYAVLKGVKVSDIDIAEMLKTMNERIAVLYDREHTIGHAYFMPLKNKDEPKIADLKDIFRNKILPLLQEYFYEDYGKIRLVLGDKQKGENEQFIIKGQLDYNGLFGSTDEIDLGERTDIYKINKKHLEDKNLTDVFLNPKAYIGIYDVTDVKPSESHG